ncbi:hypothetical protein [Corynebacterium caspium]|uniref:hypothetical protein n=1 Tax=Corynebacterium caspium TaxID=234828 RepID=UPI00037BE47C|nr:hypothetical protein [Corynebacterium caspium]WKD59133.1 hypothetical protein CCASP_03645 [Corynebacterium caspium DSM 44850]
MTTPPVGPENNESSESEYPAYPSYPSVPHPEDSPNFSAKNLNGAYPAFSDIDNNFEALGTGQVATAAHPDFSGEVLPRLDYWGAIGRSFRAVFRNFTVWIPLNILSIVLGMVILFATNPQFEEVDTLYSTDALIKQIGSMALVSVAAFLLEPLLVRAANASVSNKKITWSNIYSQATYVRILLVSFLVGVLPVLVLAFISAIILFLGGAVLGSDEILFDTLLMILFIILIPVAMLLIQPLFMFSVYYADYSGATTRAALLRGIRAGRGYYLQLIVIAVISAVLAILFVVVTFGLGLLFIYAIYSITTADLARQAIGKVMAKEQATNLE